MTAGRVVTVTGRPPVPQAADNHPVKRSPAHRMHEALGARFIEEGGWLVAASYEGAEETAALRDSVGVADVTARGKIDVRGEIATLVQSVVAGGALVARISEDWALIIALADGVGDRVRALEAQAGATATVTDVTHLYAGFVLAGPALPDVLSRLTGFDTDSLAPGSAAGAPLAEIPAVVVRRNLDVPAVEVYAASEFGRYLWETLLFKARALGGGPAGWDALRSLGWA